MSDLFTRRPSVWLVVLVGLAACADRKPAPPPRAPFHRHANALELTLARLDVHVAQSPLLTGRHYALNRVACAVLRDLGAADGTLLVSSAESATVPRFALAFLREGQSHEDAVTYEPHPVGPFRALTACDSVEAILVTAGWPTRRCALEHALSDGVAKLARFHGAAAGA